MKIKSIIIAFAALFAIGCNAQSNQSSHNQNSNAMKSIVIFFSHAGDNYSVGNIKVGNTKIVADYITEITGADQFEIATSKYDGMSYQKCCDVAKAEQQNNELPPYEGKCPDLSGYDAVGEEHKLLDEMVGVERLMEEDLSRFVVLIQSEMYLRRLEVDGASAKTLCTHYLSQTMEYLQCF